jgi:AcrR family transcriptional regulator
MNMNKKALKILDATTLLFLRNGVKKVTMDEIAESAKTSKVTIYKYFLDKDTLYLHVGRHILARYIERMNAAAALQKPLMDKLCAAMDCIAAFADGGEYDLCTELAAYNHAVDAEFAAYRQAYRGAVHTLIREGMAAGCLKRELDEEMMFDYIDMGVAYYQQNAEYRAKMRGDSRFRERFMQFFISGIFADVSAVPPEE